MIEDHSTKFSPSKAASSKAHEELEAALKSLSIWPESVRRQVGELLSRFGRAVKETSLRLRRRKEEDE